MQKVDHSTALYVLLFVLQLVLFTSGWKWRCVNRQCIREFGEETSLDSLALCRLTCGQYGALWPQPTGTSAISNKTIAFDPSNISFVFLPVVTDATRGPVQQFLTSVSRIFLHNLQGMCEANCSLVPGTSVEVNVATSSYDLTLNWHTDESYSLAVSTKDNQVRVEISAQTVYGARHGLETLTQLITATKSADGSNSQLVVITTAKVSDKPAFPHRGLLLDTARNYLPLSAIRRTLDAMGAVKMNVLHWHATDSQSFPLVLPGAAELAMFGAYSDEEVYTINDIGDLINYARVRGVRILLELDMPAHAGNGWQWGPISGLGDLAVCVNQQPWRELCIQPPCGQLNPANPNVFNVLREVFKGFADKLPAGESLHMGGDEVFIPCWNQSKAITDWMKSRGMSLNQTDFLEVWGEFHKKVLQVWDDVVGNSKTPVVLWTSHLTDPDVIGKYLDKDRFVIEAWTDSLDPLASRLLEMGYQVILATKDAWYLDHGFWGQTKYHSWRKVYDNQLMTHRGVLGGEVAMWGELVDENNLDAKVWPRAAAAAERLWSNPSTSNAAAEYRLIETRERLIQRGIRPEAIAPEWCTLNEGSCAGSVNTD